MKCVVRIVTKKKKWKKMNNKKCCETKVQFKSYVNSERKKIFSKTQK